MNTNVSVRPNTDAQSAGALLVVQPEALRTYLSGPAFSKLTANCHILEGMTLLADGGRSRIPSIGIGWEANCVEGGVFAPRLGAGMLPQFVGFIPDAASSYSRPIASIDALESGYELRLNSALGQSVGTNLNKLTLRDGLRWNAIAEILRVSIPAIRKWRLKEVRPRRKHRERLASLVAFLDTLRMAGVEEPGGLVGTRLLPSYTLTLSDIFEPRHVPLLLQSLTDDKASRESMLDALGLKQWRERYRADVEIHIAADGEQAMRLIAEG